MTGSHKVHRYMWNRHWPHIRALYEVGAYDHISQHPSNWFTLPFHSRLDLSFLFWPQGPCFLTTVSNSKYRSILVADLQGPNITMKDRDSAGRPITQSPNLKQETRFSNIDQAYILIEISCQIQTQIVDHDVIKDHDTDHRYMIKMYQDYRSEKH